MDYMNFSKIIATSLSKISNDIQNIILINP